MDELRDGSDEHEAVRDGFVSPAYLVDLFVQFSGLHVAWRRGRVVLLIVGTAFAAAIAHCVVQGSL